MTSPIVNIFVIYLFFVSFLKVRSKGNIFFCEMKHIFAIWILNILRQKNNRGWKWEKIGRQKIYRSLRPNEKFWISGAA